MVIGINAVAAFKQPRTGVEEYTYQLIKHLTMLEQSKKHRFILYSHKQLKWPFPMWTQIRLASEMIKNKPDVLFIPVHVLPLIHPKNSVVTIHGLEYEYYPETYPYSHLKYLRWSTKYALKHARKIIAVSENTKKDLIKLYGGNPDKIEVVYHGYNVRPLGSNIRTDPYILFIGRIETKKNIHGLIKAFDLLKKKYQAPHKLILVGPIPRSDLFDAKRSDIEFFGYVSEQKKQQLLKNAEMFILPSFYEGFGMPILEAQASGCPVITSNVSSMPEVAGQGAILIEPKNIEQIAESMYKIINDSQLKKDLIEKGYENIKKFSWQKCAQETLEILTN
ncbi:MAG: glycosyltransferase family 4 protein [Parcubacteria group bacterium]|nr:glycosyltransferase family 4 protein [Parcubacteria group bacterium]